MPSDASFADKLTFFYSSNLAAGWHDGSDFQESNPGRRRSSEPERIRQVMINS